MSISLMSLVWQTGLPLNQKAALLALADWANDRGGSIHPSIYTISERLTCSERTAQRLLKELVEQGWLAVVGNPFGGARGATRRYCINVPKLREIATLEEGRRASERAMMRQRNEEDDAEFGLFQTGDKLTGVDAEATGDNLSRVTNQVLTGDKSGSVGVTNQVSRGDTSVTQYTIDPPIEPPKNHLQSAMPPALELVTDVIAKPVKSSVSRKPSAEETALQGACRETWAAYSSAYVQRYGIAPVRNQQVNAKVKAFVQRIGYAEAPGVARFYVERVSERFVVGKCHDVGLLLSGAEGYRTQWATGQAMTSTRAQQADKSQANYDAAAEAMALIRARRGVTNAE